MGIREIREDIKEARAEIRSLRTDLTTVIDVVGMLAQVFERSADDTDEARVYLTEAAEGAASALNAVAIIEDRARASLRALPARTRKRLGLPTP